MAHKTHDRLRKALANETAKIIAIEGVRDYHRAKLKACERLGNSLYGSMPSNLEIEKAIIAYQNTFIPEHGEIITAQRKTALAIMQWLGAYSPYLTGSVLEGTAAVNNVISIHVFSETVESILEILESNHIKTSSTQRRIKLNGDFVFVPTLSFEYQKFAIEVLIFSLRQRHQQPKSKSKHRGMPRINVKKLKLLLDE